MSDLRIKANIENGDLPKQMEFDFNKKEFEPMPLTLIDIINLGKFTELLEGNKKD